MSAERRQQISRVVTTPTPTLESIARGETGCQIRRGGRDISDSWGSTADALGHVDPSKLVISVPPLPEIDL